MSFGLQVLSGRISVGGDLFLGSKPFSVRERADIAVCGWRYYALLFVFAILHVFVYLGWLALCHAVG